MNAVCLFLLFPLLSINAMWTPNIDPETETVIGDEDQPINDYAQFDADADDHQETPTRLHAIELLRKYNYTKSQVFVFCFLAQIMAFVFFCRVYVRHRYSL